MKAVRKGSSADISLHVFDYMQRFDAIFCFWD